MDPTDQKKTACYDIDVEVDDPLKGQMNSFLSSTTNQQEIAALEIKVRPAEDRTITFPYVKVSLCVTVLVGSPADS